ncbi:MAG: hypothetical protein ACJ70S_09270 [Nitrososphaera sp.]
MYKRRFSRNTRANMMHLKQYLGTVLMPLVVLTFHSRQKMQYRRRARESAFRKRK